MDDYSDSSFQIPVAASSSSNYLLADEDSDFLAGSESTLATPAPPTRTRTRSGKNPPFGEPTPKAKTPRIPVRRSPRKHRTTPALPSPLKPVVERSPSPSADAPLSPLTPPPERSFELPALRDADVDLLMADDSGELFRAVDDSTLGDAPPTPAPASKERTAARDSSPPRAAPSSPPAALRSLPARENQEEDSPEASTPAVSGSSPACARVENAPPRSFPMSDLNLVPAVEACGGSTEQPRPSEAAPRDRSPAEARARALGAPDAQPDGGGGAPGDAAPSDAAEDPSPSPPAPAPAALPAPPRRPPARRASQVKTQSATAGGGGIARPATLRARTSSGVRGAKAWRGPRAASVAVDDAPAAGPSAQSPPVGARGSSVVPKVTAASPCEQPPQAPGESGFAGEDVLPAHDARGAGAQGSDTIAPALPAGEDRRPDVDVAPQDVLAAAESPMDTLEDTRAEGESIMDTRADGPSDEAPHAHRPAPDHDDAMDVQPASPAAPPSPMRRATKRAASPADDSDVPAPAPRKRTRTDEPAPAPRTRARTSASTASAHAPQTRAAAALAAKRSVRVLRSSRLKNRAPGGAQPEPAPGPAAPTASRQDSQVTASGPAPARARAAGRSGGPARAPSSSSQQAEGKVPAAPLTKPVAFRFASDARIEARRAEPGSSSAAAVPRMGPDFSALHAAHAHALAARRPAAAPTVPAARVLSTEVRAATRERFDAARRAREAEAEAAREEERRLRELQEAAEVRELRRRAVPRAHEVPAWYADMPKRAHDAAA